MGVFGLPLLPVRGVMWLGRVIRDEADRTVHDPVRIREQLVELDAAHRRGDINASDYRQLQRELVDLLWNRESP